MNLLKIQSFKQFLSQLSLKTKLSWLFLISTILPFIVIGYYGYNSTVQSLVNNMLADDEQDVRNMTNNLQNLMNTVPADLHFLANFYALNKFLQWHSVGDPYKTVQWLKDSQNAFHSFLDSKRLYLQLQVVSTDGQELLNIRHNALNDQTTIESTVNSPTLYNEDYVTKTLSLKKDQFYVSDLTLGKDKENQGEPVIRYATPIIDSANVTQGIVILSLHARAPFDILKRESAKGLMTNNYSYLLVNQSGEYLYHPNENKVWNHRHESHASLQVDEPDLFDSVSHKTYGTEITGSWVSTFRQVLPLQGSPKPYWILIKRTNRDVALADVNSFKYVFLLVIIGIGLIVLIITNRFTRAILTVLLKVNTHLKALSQGQLIDSDIEYSGTDEITEIVASTDQLKKSVKATIAQANAVAAGNYTNQIKLLSEQDQLGKALRDMTCTLRDMTTRNNAQAWLKTGQTQLSEKVSGEQDLSVLGKNIITFLTPYLQAQVGVFYIVDNSNPQKTCLKLLASYAHTRRKELANEFELGEGLIGQVALERQTIVINRVPEDYLIVQSGLGEAKPSSIIAFPFLYEGVLGGVIEMASFNEFTDLHLELLSQVISTIGVAMNTAESRTRMQVLLHQTQLQAEELQTQAEELQTQQEELRQSNEELEARTLELERQKDEIKQKNAALQQSQREIESKAKELELASKYKSEFLANMSHELRTPLNSLLILSQLLSENKSGRMDEKQVEYARTIHSAGNDLLTLINEILDLSKVEAGKMEVQIEELDLREVMRSTEQKFRHVAEKKKLSFPVHVGGNVPTSIRTDGQRLKQIINNLLSNAFKFTSEGSVCLEVRRPNDDLPHLSLKAQDSIAVSVMDTGIGIPKGKQQLVFEAFQQVDGTTSRKYGGTGLGLSISRQLARLLGGDIVLVSEEGKGSTFTLYLPQILLPKSGHTIKQPTAAEAFLTSLSAPVPEKLKVIDVPHDTVAEPRLKKETASEVLETQSIIQETPSILSHASSMPDDRDNLEADDKFILIIDDDRKFLEVLVELAHEKQFKCLIAEDGKTGLYLAEGYQPHAIILDVGLPQLDGWSVMERLKDNPKTRHIPVHFISASDQNQEAKKLGAIGYLLKPVSVGELGEAFRKIERFIENRVRNLLVIADNEHRKQKIIEVVANDQVQCTLVTTAEQALKQLSTTLFDCIVLDVDVGEGKGIHLLEQLQLEEANTQIPVIIYAERELTEQEDRLLQEVSDNLTVKAVRSPERLLDEATLFLHQLETKLPQEKQRMLHKVHDKEAILAHKKVLIVDDDMRNTFALATVLEDKDMEVIVAKNGKEALSLLEKHADVAIVLMDIMMPEMDGYEATRHIRSQERFRKLPIVALTAKAMKGDKAKCIEAGANDYLSKPVETDKLLSLMRVWLYR